MALTDVPLAAQTLAQTQNPIRQNFLTVNSAFLVDHVEYNLANQGKHNKVTFVRQSGNPATAPTDMVMFSKLSTFSNMSQLYIRDQNNGNVFEFTDGIANTPGWTRLPSGILLMWNDANPTAGGSTIAYPVGATFPVFNAVFNVQVTCKNNAASDPNTFGYVTNITNLNFSYFSTQRTTTGTAGSRINYLAIGI